MVYNAKAFRPTQNVPFGTSGLAECASSNLLSSTLHSAGIKIRVILIRRPRLENAERHTV